MTEQEMEILKYMDKVWGDAKRTTCQYDGAWEAVTMLGYDISRNSDGVHVIVKSKPEDISRMEQACNEYMKQFNNISNRAERFSSFNRFIGISNIARLAGFAWFKKKDGNIFFYRKSEPDENAPNETTLHSFRSLKHDDIIINTKTGQAYKTIIDITGKKILMSMSDNVVCETKGKKAKDFVKVD